MYAVSSVSTVAISPFLRRAAPFCSRRYATAGAKLQGQAQVQKKPQTLSQTSKPKQGNPQAGSKKKDTNAKAASEAPGDALAAEKVRLTPKPMGPRRAQLSLSRIPFAGLIGLEKIPMRMAETIPYRFATQFQNVALEPLLEGKNALVQSPEKGLATSYLIPLISKYIDWKNETKQTPSDPAPSSTQSKKSKRKPQEPSLSDIVRSGTGPVTTRLIIVCPTADRALAVAAKCVELIPENGPTSVVCLTHVKTPEKEREWVFKRRADILVTTPFPILDHIILTKHYNYALARLKCIVFDSADEFTEPKWLPALNKLLITERLNHPPQAVISAHEKTSMLEKFTKLVFDHLPYVRIFN